MNFSRCERKQSNPGAKDKIYLVASGLLSRLRSSQLTVGIN